MTTTPTTREQMVTNKIIQQYQESMREFEEKFPLKVPLGIAGHSGVKRNVVPRKEIESFLTRSYAALLSAVESEMPEKALRPEEGSGSAKAYAYGFNVARNSALKPIQEAKEFVNNSQY